MQGSDQPMGTPMDVPASDSIHYRRCTLLHATSSQVSAVTRPPSHSLFSSPPMTTIWGYAHVSLFIPVCATESSLPLFRQSRQSRFPELSRLCPISTLHSPEYMEARRLRSQRRVKPCVAQNYPPCLQISPSPSYFLRNGFFSWKIGEVLGRSAWLAYKE